MTTVNGLIISDGCRLGIKPGFQNPVGGGQGGSTPVVLVPFDPSAAEVPFEPGEEPGGGGGGSGSPGGGDPTVTSEGDPDPEGGEGDPTGGGNRPGGGGIGGGGGGGTSIPLGRLPSLGRAPNPPNVDPGGGGIPTGRLPSLGQATNPPNFDPGVQIPVGRLPSIGQAPEPPNVDPGGGIPIGRLPLIPQVEDPNQGYVNTTLGQANSIAQNQASTNGEEIVVNQAISNIIDPNATTISNPIYDPQKNFFKLTPNRNIKAVPNGSYLNVFREFVAEEVYDIFFYQEGKTKSWDEKSIQNLTDDKIIFSLNVNLLEAFNNLRDATGKQIGISTFANVIRKHLVTGTLNEINTDYYLDAYNTQKNSKFTSFVKSESESSNELFSLLYLREQRYGLGFPKDTFQNQIEMGRFRFLNEDLKLSLRIDRTDGTVSKLTVPNQGFPITYLNPVDVSTTPAVGSTNLLNIGDGGGYYIQSKLIDGEGKPVVLDGLVSSTFYAPASVRSSLLDLVDSGFQYEITADSLTNEHEFVSGDAGPSTLTPLYFGIELSSAGTVAFSKPSVEDYSATYFRMTDSDDIQKHLNNNALAVPQVYLDYRDPLYRYILDTSSFSLKASDISNKDFVANPTLLRDDNFVKNIPFGFVIVPSQGSNFNPFNGRSKVSSLGEKVTRKILLTPSLNRGITSNEGVGFDFYNTYLDDGSTRIGSFEEESVHNFGYRYDPSKFHNTFYVNDSLGTSSSPVSSYGASYLVKDVLDYIKDTYDPESVVWFDVFSRMPLSRIGELMYDLHDGFLDRLKNGFRHGIKIKNAQRNNLNPVSLLTEDSKTIVESATRPNVKLIDR